MKQQDFEYLQQLLKERSGIILAADKTYLVESRLMPVARSRGLTGLDELLQALRVRPDTALVTEVIDAMTTNESFFFRDIKPFESFRQQVLPRIVAARKAAGGNRVRIWSAACSSGQEPYTLAMILRESPELAAGLQFEIIATDLSTEIVAKAKAGIYTQFEVQRGLPIQLLVKYFKQIGERWQIAESIRNMVSVRTFNLLDDYRGLGTFDVVFCRNVLIYFDQQTKSGVLDRIAAQLAPDGFLYLGGAESVLGLTQSFSPIEGMRGVYGRTALGASAGLRQRAG